MIHKEDPRWVDKYNDAQDVAKKVSSDVKAIFKKIQNANTKEPNFVELTSERFNGGSGDTATLYEVAKFIEDLYRQWMNPTPEQDK